jgi:FkbM family methyltransferase
MISRTYHGKMHIYENNDLVSKSLEVYGEWAKNEILFIKEFMLKEGDSILDVGAHIGSYTLALNYLMNRKCKINSIEPDIDNFKLLKENVKLSNSDSITIHNNSTKIDISSKSILLGSVTDHGQKTVSSNRIAMDDTLMTEIINESDLIKIDIEGSELFFLKNYYKNFNLEKNKFIIEVLDIPQAWEVSKLFIDLEMKVFGMQTKAFNANNFLGNRKNIFLSGTEFVIIAVPRNFRLDISKLDMQINLISEINEFHDLLKIMLLQSQLVNKIFDSETNSNATHALKYVYKNFENSIINFWSSI